MAEARDFCDLTNVYARAEPDDEYNYKRDPLEPFLIDEDEEEEEIREEEDEDDL